MERDQIVNNLQLIKDSHKKCKECGISREEIIVPKFRLSEEQLAQRKIKFQNILEVFRSFFETTTIFMLNIPMLVTLNDNEGYLLEVQGDQYIQNFVEEVGIREGVEFTEDGIGTNSITLCLLEKRPIQVIGTDHYQTYLYATACYSVPLFSPNNEVIGCLTIMTTINHTNPLILSLLSSIGESFSRELKLRHQNKKLEFLSHIITNKTKNGIIIVDSHGRILEFNTSAEKITGLHKESTIGESIYELHPFSQYYIDIVEKGVDFQDVQIEISNDDVLNKKCCIIDAAPMYDDQTIIIGVIFQFRDITDYRILEEQIVRLDKLSLIGQLAAGVAHEIRNPLFSIRGFLQLIFEDHDRTKNYKELVLSEVDRIDRLVNDFVMVTRPSSPQKKIVNFDQLIDETISFLESEAKLHNAAISYTAEHDNIHIEADRGQLKQVFINIIKNSMEACETKAIVKIHAKVHVDQLIIKICDNGPGISPDQMKNVFNPFFTTKENGVGLGLAISNRIIEAHAGTIEIVSDPNGTCTIISLPFSDIEI